MSWVTTLAVSTIIAATAIRNAAGKHCPPPSMPVSMPGVFYPTTDDMDYQDLLKKLKRSNAAWDATTGKINCSKIAAENTIDGKEFPSIDGLCNNLNNPIWGATKAPYARIAGTHFGGDGLGDPVTKRLGRTLPNARKISTSYDTGRTLLNFKHSFLTVEFGHFVAHEVSKKSGGSNVNCDEDAKNPICFSIPMPPSDSQFGALQPNEALRLPNLGLKRSATIELVKEANKTQPRQQFNDNTGFIDGSAVCGSKIDTAASLRQTNGADLLAELVTFHGKQGKDLLPFDAGFSGKVNAKCQGRIPLCYHAGDTRATQSTTLATVHTLWLREHNRVVASLKAMNAHWSEERAYREARLIVAALLQHVVYDEYIATLLGKDVVDASLPAYTGYDDCVNPSIFIEFATAAFRMGHSQMATRVQWRDPDYNLIDEHRYRFDFKQVDHYYLRQDGSFDNYMRGLLGQSAYEIDRFTTGELTNYLFQPRDLKGRFVAPADDLTAVTIQRGRDHGLASYVIMRDIALKHFEEKNVAVPDPPIRAAVLNRLLAIYDDIERVDLYVGGVSETHMKESEVGPTFAYIIAKQFLHSRDGDRFFYKNPDVGSGRPVFTREQVTAIDATTMAAIVCGVADDSDTMKIQEKAFDFMGKRTGKIERKRCEDILAEQGLDLTPWKGKIVISIDYFT